MLRLYASLVMNAREIRTFGLERGEAGKITGPSYPYRVQGIVDFLERGSSASGRRLRLAACALNLPQVQNLREVIRKDIRSSTKLQER